MLNNAYNMYTPQWNIQTPNLSNYGMGFTPPEQTALGLAWNNPFTTKTEIPDFQKTQQSVKGAEFTDSINPNVLSTAGSMLGMMSGGGLSQGQNATREGIRKAIGQMGP